jgi:hypothetical protein
VVQGECKERGSHTSPDAGTMGARAVSKPRRACWRASMVRWARPALASLRW